VRPHLVAAIALLTAGSVAAAPKTKAKATKKKARSATKKEHLSSRFETPSDADTMPAVHYGALSVADCEAELGKRGIAFETETARGVFAPVRLTSKLHGIEFRTDESEAKDKTSPYEIADCRLVLAMDDFAAILVQHDVVLVRHYSMWRPPPKSWPDDKIGSRHDGALALDAGRFTKSDGTVLDIVKDFHGAIGDKTCGDGAGPHPATDKAKELRSILCDTVTAHLFNVVLTPNFNRPHRNHFHLEVTSGVKWFLVH
jgi:hypothetical protein